MILLCCAWALVAQTSDVVVEAPAALDKPTQPATPELSPRITACLAQAPADVPGARRCLQALSNDAHSSPFEQLQALQAELVLRRLQRHLRPATPPAPPAPPVLAPPAITPVDTQALVDGPLEAGINGALFGAFAGFSATAGVLAGLRTSEDDAFPWLLSAPALGAIAGAGASLLALEWLHADANDVAFVSSTTWAGVALGLSLQLAVFADSNDVQAAPLRFFTTLGGGVLGLGLGAGLAAVVNVEAGDASLANSGLVWGAALAGLGLWSARGAGLGFSTSTVVVGAAGLLSWGTLMALHPWLKLQRVSTWLVDVGGGVGLGLGAFVGGGLAFATRDANVFGSACTVGTALGLGFGVAAALVADPSLQKALAAPTPLALLPALLSTPTGIAPAVLLQGELW